MDMMVVSAIQVGSTELKERLALAATSLEWVLEGSSEGQNRNDG